MFSFRRLPRCARNDNMILMSSRTNVRRSALDGLQEIASPALAMTGILNSLYDLIKFVEVDCYFVVLLSMIGQSDFESQNL